MKFGYHFQLDNNLESDLTNPLATSFWFFPKAFSRSGYLFSVEGMHHAAVEVVYNDPEENNSQVLDEGVAVPRLLLLITPRNIHLSVLTTQPLQNQAHK